MAKDKNGYLFIVIKAFRISDPPAHSLTEQNSNLFLIPQGFRIFDPQSRQGTKMDICSWSSKYSEFLIPITARDKNDYLFMLVKVLKISDPQAT